MERSGWGALCQALRGEQKVLLPLAGRACPCSPCCCFKGRAVSTLNSLWPPFGSGHVVNTRPWSNTGFSLMIPSLAPKGDVRNSICCVTLMRAAGQAGLAAGMGRSNSSSLLCTLVLIAECQNTYPRCFSSCPASSETSLPMGGRSRPWNALPGFPVTAGTAQSAGPRKEIALLWGMCNSLKTGTQIPS